MHYMDQSIVTPSKYIFMISYSEPMSINVESLPLCSYNSRWFGSLQVLSVKDFTALCSSALANPVL